MPVRLFLLSLSIVVLGVLAIAACGGDGDAGDEPKEADVDLEALEEGVPASIVVTSSFADGEAIPGKHSCYGLGLSPPVSWTGAPEGTKSIAVVLVEPDSPDGENWVHWLLYGIPPATTEVPEALTQHRSGPGGRDARQERLQTAGMGRAVPREGRRRLLPPQGLCARHGDRPRGGRHEG